MRRWIRGTGSFFVAIWLLLTPVWAAGPEALVPVGDSVSLELQTDGVYVQQLDTLGDSPAREGGLRIGDRIVRCDGTALDSAQALTGLVQASGGKGMILEIIRNGKQMSFTVYPKAEDGAWKLGLYARDRICGVGTVTYFDPATGTYGALGHGVHCEEGGSLLPIRGGRMAEASIATVIPGKAGAPGELCADSVPSTVLGTVEANTEQGIFGHVSEDAWQGDALPLAVGSEVQTGAAEIWSNVAGTVTEHYTVTIEKLSPTAPNDRNIQLKVTDPRLLNATGGIVQGMSGSPIVQNGKLVGAVTHVLIQDPEQGYGILIENMLDASAQVQ